MEENVVEQYTPEKKLTKREVVSAFWRWTFFSHANYNYERLQATGVVHALSPVLKKLYGKDSDEMKSALERHMQFFNTEPSFGGPILSMTIAMEEQKANGAEIGDATINGLKTGLMGPLAGIGDTLWQGTLIPILLSFTLAFGAEGNILLGPVAFFVLHLGIMTSIAYFLWMKGYETGKDGIQKMLSGSLLPYVMTFAQTLGAIVIGSLAASFVKVGTDTSIKLSGDKVLSMQTDVLDTLLLGLLPLGATMLTYILLKKKMKPTTVLLILIVGGGILAALGILTNVY
ncbi:PTS system mannose/fructose/sorbose family transporter subunit IID [Enterococcus sp. CWB-B31]|uniref:PTS system mannose/fructose/sorbose family transporter subunit IID n=1 Tax=Enterococcus sp. CWB-B31 TaxID=2885159 RepID=UPI001E2D6B1E|nr:PTS system mannose/fructose/sorbose family transporter subunit IID [Enterococcus sp. CWB-B31]MCB5955716.1 PTS system mannose/fructose/sorbose family transporter subunit IID [Enterococcus sp. CWB-B31]